MKKLYLFLITIFIFACTQENENKSTKTTSNKITGSLYSLSENGLDEELGEITVAGLSTGGIYITVKASGLIPGKHGFHLHEKNILTPITNTDGSVVIGGMAGGHWDPDNTKIHAGPNGNGHRGDLPRLTVESDGSVDETFEVARINFSDIDGKSFMIHASGDNYSDNPKALGGGGARLYACPF